MDLTSRNLVALLIAARKARGWSQREMAYRMGSKQTRLCQYELGDLVPELDTVLRWIVALGIQVDLMVPFGSTGRTMKMTLGKVAGGDPDSGDPAQDS